MADCDNIGCSLNFEQTGKPLATCPNTHDHWRAARPGLICAGCRRQPAEISSYTMMLEDPDAIEEYGTVEEYVWREEGTLNRQTGRFLCDECYIKAGMPSSPMGWTVPDHVR